MYAPSLSKVESLSHLFYECDTLKGLWPFIACIIFEITGYPVNITIQVILFNVLKPHSNSHFTELLLLVNMLKYCIWIKRNEVKHEQKKISTSNIKAFFINTLILRIPLSSSQTIGCTSPPTSVYIRRQTHRPPKMPREADGSHTPTPLNQPLSPCHATCSMFYCICVYIYMCG